MSHSTLLPPELIWQIAEDLDRPTLIQFALLNRSFHRAITPLLYRKIPCLKSSSTAALLYTLSNFKDLACHVEQLRILVPDEKSPTASNESSSVIGWFAYRTVQAVMDYMAPPESPLTKTLGFFASAIQHMSSLRTLVVHGSSQAQFWNSCPPITTLREVRMPSLRNAPVSFLVWALQQKSIESLQIYCQSYWKLEWQDGSATLHQIYPVVRSSRVDFTVYVRRTETISPSMPHLRTLDTNLCGLEWLFPYAPIETLHLQLASDNSPEDIRTQFGKMSETNSLVWLSLFGASGKLDAIFWTATPPFIQGVSRLQLYYDFGLSNDSMRVLKSRLPDFTKLHTLEIFLGPPRENHEDHEILQPDGEEQVQKERADARELKILCPSLKTVRFPSHSKYSVD